MDREVMTNEENYCFDVAGYLHVPKTLTSVEIDQLNVAITEHEREALRVHFRELHA